MKKITGRAILAIVAFLLAIFLFELGLRLFLPMPENLAKLESSSLFLYENKANAVFPYITSEFENEIHINSHGFRDNEFSSQKDSSTLRIAVLGDSQEEALQVPLDDTWQKIMATKLSEELSRRVESYNFGISGYGTDQEWLTLRDKVWQFKPDIVILAFSPNDVGDTYKNRLVRWNNGRIEVISSKERAGGNFVGKLFRETYMYHLIVKAASANPKSKKIVDKIRTKILGFPKDERFFLSDAQLVQGPFEVVASQKNPPKEVLGTWQIIRSLLADMKKQTDDHGAKLLITINIPRAQVLPSDWDILRDKYKLDQNQSSPYQINEVVGQITKDLGISFYDDRLDAIDWKEKTGDLHFLKDAHFNKNGHLFMGTKVAEFIINNHLISPLVP